MNIIDTSPLQTVQNIYWL